MKIQTKTNSWVNSSKLVILIPKIRLWEGPKTFPSDLRSSFRWSCSHIFNILWAAENNVKKEKKFIWIQEVWSRYSFSYLQPFCLKQQTLSVVYLPPRIFLYISVSIYLYCVVGYNIFVYEPFRLKHCITDKWQTENWYILIYSCVYINL